MRRGAVILLVGLALSWASSADTLNGRVVGISDGDTLKLLDPANTQYRIRLAAIDAPEKAMRFGQASKKALSDICFGKHAIVDVVDTDRYGRSVGVVTCEGANANESQVKTGYAWVYRKYSKGFGYLIHLENEARAGKLGLWSDLNPMPPWEWRHRNSND